MPATRANPSELASPSSPGADNVFDTSALSPTLVNALIAAEINELGEFVRLPLVIATTPALSRRLKALRR